jgi:hypothetical protein
MLIFYLRTGDGAVPFLTGRIPNLSFNGFVFYRDGSSSEFDTDGGFGFKVEFVTSETREKVGFTDTRVTDQDN